MLIETGYNRTEANDYVKEWAYRRNPKYLDFKNIGGDCTNFVSQCIYAGTGVMNYTSVFGWYYIDSKRRAASWTGVEYLYNFLTQNRKEGPYGIDSDIDFMEIGDIVQLGNEKGFYHTAIVCGFSDNEILVAAHTFDAYNRPLSTYSYEKIRYTHILGSRTLKV